MILDGVKIRGILPVNKPVHITSYDCIRKIQPLFPRVKIGHAGTLDPIASGLLLLLFNEATKIAQYVSISDKGYIATIRLGITTDTDDITGQIIKDRPYEHISQSQVEQTLEKFLGEISQIPPKYSALKQHGVKFYQLARKGIDFTPTPRMVNIKAIELTDFNLPLINIKTLVSKGTYIRALARDVGELLGCGATLEALMRIQVGRFIIENAVDLQDIKPETIAESLYPINEVLFSMPAVIVSLSDINRILKGQSLAESQDWNLEPGTYPIRVVDEENRVLIIGRHQDNRVYPDRVIYADL